jgi:hypothetical protein
VLSGNGERMSEMESIGDTPFHLIVQVVIILVLLAIVCILDAIKKQAGAAPMTPDAQQEMSRNE